MDENACGFAENEKTRRAAFSTLFPHLFSLKKASHEPRTRYSLHCMIIIFQQNWRKETLVMFEEDTVSREKEFRESFQHSTFSRAVPVSIEKNAPVSWESSGFCQRVGLVSGIFLGLGGARSEGLVLSAACALHPRDEYGFQRVGAFWENFSNVRAQNLFDR